MNAVGPTKILFLRLEKADAEEEYEKLSARDLSFLFNKGHAVQRVLLISKTSLVKAFVEFSSPEESIAAYKGYNNKYINGLGQLKLFFSPLKDIERSAEEVDFYEKEEIEEKEEKQIHGILEKEPEVDQRAEDKDTREIVSKNNSEQESTRENIQQNKPLNKKAYQLERFDQYSRIFKPQGSGKIRKENKANIAYEQNSFSSDVPFYHRAADLTQQSITNNKKVSKVVSFSNLSFIFKSCSEILNLFGCFGNIRNIVFLKKQQRALIEYHTYKGSKNAIRGINNRKLGPARLKVSYSNKEHLNKDYDPKDIQLAFAEVLHVSEDMNRYKKGYKGKFQRASSSLTLVTQWTSDIKPIDVYFMIEQFCKPVSLKIEQKTVNGDRAMVFHLELGSEQAAISLVYKCHGLCVRNSRLDISFKSEPSK